MSYRPPPVKYLLANKGLTTADVGNTYDTAVISKPSDLVRVVIESPVATLPSGTFTWVVFGSFDSTLWLPLDTVLVGDFSVNTLGTTNYYTNTYSAFPYLRVALLQLTVSTFTTSLWVQI